MKILDKECKALGIYGRNHNYCIGREVSLKKHVVIVKAEIPLTPEVQGHQEVKRKESSEGAVRSSHIS